MAIRQAYSQPIPKGKTDWTQTLVMCIFMSITNSG
jgi:hypothetical protein